MTITAYSKVGHRQLAYRTRSRSLVHAALFSSRYVQPADCSPANCSIIRRLRRGRPPRYRGGITQARSACKAIAPGGCSSRRREKCPDITRC